MNSLQSSRQTKKLVSSSRTSDAVPRSPLSYHGYFPWLFIYLRLLDGTGISE